MNRLAADVRLARGERHRLIEAIGRAASARRRTVSQMQARFRIEHLRMARVQHQALSDFSARITRLVSALREDVHGDLRGARRAWSGTPRPVTAPEPITMPTPTSSTPVQTVPGVEPAPVSSTPRVRHKEHATRAK
jgi:hypothetical protein